MATIKDIIFTEFLKYDYNIITEQGGAVIFKHNVFEDFWVVSASGFTLGRQHDLYEATVKAIVEKYPFAPKNTALLVLSDMAKEQLTPDQIVECEKDPFFFKKYVLLYSDELVQQLVEKLERKKAQSISDLIMLPESFNTLNEEDGYGMYHLLYSIAHKLPFVPIKAEQKGLQQRDFLFDLPGEWNAMDDVTAIVGDAQAVYDYLKSKIEQEADEQH